MVTISSIIFLLSLFFLIIGDVLDATFNVIGIRIATLFVAFAAFCSTSSFSYLVYNHNRTVSRVNDDANKRAELFRELQFASSNYSIIDFTDCMIIYGESIRYVDKFVGNKILTFHMIEDRINEQDVLNNPEDFTFLSIRIPYRVVEGKVVSKIKFERLKFERNGLAYRFITPPSEKESIAFLLYNEHTKRSESIINLIVSKKSDFFILGNINEFSKIKITIKVTSLLGVEVDGITELYFTNPERKEADGSNTYKVNSSNFTLNNMPRVGNLYNQNQDIL
jgi:hypothetical protein